MDITPAVPADRLFPFRYAVARVGEEDWLKWWECHALTKAGLYSVRRLFPRTALLSAAHLAIASARVRHDAAVPDEPLVHLFNFGELYESDFERWLVRQKAEGWTPGSLPDEPPEAARDSVGSALRATFDALGLPVSDDGSGDATKENGGNAEGTPADGTTNTNGNGSAATGADPDGPSGDGPSRAVAVRTVTAEDLSDGDACLAAVQELVEAYRKSEPGRLVVPYLRVEA